LGMKGDWNGASVTGISTIYAMFVQTRRNPCRAGTENDELAAKRAPLRRRCP
jgi:hypothetical protein